MARSSNELEVLTERETKHFCLVEQSLQEADTIMGHPLARPHDHARMANCAVATALLQHNLAVHHNIATRRVITTVDSAPRSEFNGRPFRHVLLVHDTPTSSEAIDPTYGQFWQWFGLRPSTKATTTPIDYPEKLALHVDLADPQTSLEPVVDVLSAAREQPANYPAYQPLRAAGRATLRTILGDIYNPNGFRPFEIGVQDHRSYNTLLAHSIALRETATDQPLHAA